MTLMTHGNRSQMSNPHNRIFARIDLRPLEYPAVASGGIFLASERSTNIEMAIPSLRYFSCHERLRNKLPDIVVFLHRRSITRAVKLPERA